MQNPNQEGLSDLRNDPDIRSENLDLPMGGLALEASSSPPTGEPVPLVVISGSMRATEASSELARDVGGVKAFQQFTARFYVMAFQDPVIDKFIREHGDHHGQRFASWIAEKMGHGTPWSTERRTRKQCPFSAHGHDFDSAFDRSSAHFAAWHSPKREPERWGEHFQLDDARIWMRLHFWAMREAGIADAHPRFAEYYCRLIGHFVSVYERLATPFARESMRWSADPANTQRYLDGGRRMPDVHVTPEAAIRALPAHERQYHGSSDRNKTWPYV